VNRNRNRNSDALGRELREAPLTRLWGHFLAATHRERGPLSPPFTTRVAEGVKAEGGCGWVGGGGVARVEEGGVGGQWARREGGWGAWGGGGWQGAHGPSGDARGGGGRGPSAPADRLPRACALLYVPSSVRAPASSACAPQPAEGSIAQTGQQCAPRQRACPAAACAAAARVPPRLPAAHLRVQLVPLDRAGPRLARLQLLQRYVQLAALCGGVRVLGF
jgi:hypothetical protein